MNHDLDVFCENLYAEVQQYWKDKRRFIPQTGELKFGIFYSPVRHRPALMIMGANPGFDSDDDTKAAPPENLFFDPVGRKKEEFKIASVLRKLFRLADQEETLRNSVVTNLLFFKSRCLGRHTKTKQGWCDNGDAKVRREIEDYCRNRVEAIVRRVDPIRILVFGLTTWDKLVEGQVNVMAHRTNGRARIAAKGMVFDRNALGIIHPTGARLSNNDFCELAKALGKFLFSSE